MIMPDVILRARLEVTSMTLVNTPLSDGLAGHARNIGTIRLSNWKFTCRTHFSVTHSWASLSLRNLFRHFDPKQSTVFKF